MNDRELFTMELLKAFADTLQRVGLAAPEKYRGMDGQEGIDAIIDATYMLHEMMKKSRDETMRHKENGGFEHIREILKRKFNNKPNYNQT